MRVIRTLHPVGQGAFYTEQFISDKGIVNVVFDCGSENSHALKQCVGKYCKYIEPRDTDPVIDAVFISHFDEDHISGLEELFSKCFIKMIFLPLIDDSKVYSISDSFLDGLESSFFRNVLNSAITGNPIEGFSETKVIRVMAAEDNDGENDSIIPLDDGFVENKQSLIKSGTSISLTNNGKVVWIFRTFNYDNDNGQRSVPLLHILSADGITLCLNELLNHLFDANPWRSTGKTYKELVHDAYDCVGSKKTQNINDNSMVTYSGPINDKVKCHLKNIFCNRFDEFFCCDFLFCHCYFYNQYYYKAGCMYFGDYNAKSQKNYNQYENHFKKQISLLQLLQIPHHGSYANYNSKLNLPPKISFISAGLHNRHKHPSGNVLLDMEKNYVPWLWIHEYFGYVFMKYNIQ